MADDTTSSPDPSSPEPVPPNPSTPEPAEQAEQAVEAVEELPVQSVELVEPIEPIEPVERVEQVVEQTADAAEPVSAPPEPSVATTLVVEPTPAPLATQANPSADGEGQGEGGEWELLLQNVRQWLNQGELQSLWSQARKPVTLLAAVVGLLLVLRVYSAVLGALDSLPLVPGLLELAGVVWTVRYGVPKLLRSSERDRLLSGLSNRWKAFRGKG